MVGVGVSSLLLVYSSFLIFKGDGLLDEVAWAENEEKMLIKRDRYFISTTLHDFRLVFRLIPLRR